jgi:hypothetical protein
MMSMIDSGEAWINSASVNTQLGEARKLLGLCPQFDALMGNLTWCPLVTVALVRGGWQVVEHHLRCQPPRYFQMLYERCGLS